MGTGTGGQEKDTNSFPRRSSPSLPSATICGYLGLICVHLWLKILFLAPTLLGLTALP
ncbi:hypothetical protein IAD21_04394 [Abditibacteriota bacterium]|nr:hypothetical protein IAD21_04394 [Abditibacteriota bacterium]